MDGWMDESHLRWDKTQVCCSPRVQCVSLTAFFLLFHSSYFMDGRVNKVEDFLKTRLLDTLTEQITKVTKVITFPSKL